MVKQFTIPCKFGNEMSPVTLYIGHPEADHHPVKFQSDWLSSVKGGTIPQDLMDTLQKLHDLAIENGADFEELCYYALISATQHSSGGVSPDDINKYADEFVKKEGNVETSTDTNTNSNDQENNNNNVNNDIKNNDSSNIKDAEPVFDKKKSNDDNNSTDTTSNNTQEKIQPTLDIKSDNYESNDSQDAKINVDNNEDILKNIDDLDDNNNNNSSTNSSNSGSASGSSDSSTFSQEDEDLLLDDDLSTF